MKRISQLDGVRGIAILLVLAYHYFNCQVVPKPRSVLSYSHDALNLAWSGVDLFFVLSGFLIAGILLDHRKASNYFRVFYFRRFCRIFPLYFLMLGLFVCLSATTISGSPTFQWLFSDPFPIWSYATFTQNIFMGIRGYFGPNWLAITWSLAVEEQFYLVVPLLIYFLPRRVLLCVFLIGVLMAPLLRCASPGFHAYVETPWRADSILSGASLAVLVRWHPFVSIMQQYRRIIFALFLALLAGAALMSIKPDHFGEFDKFWLAGLYAAFVLVAFDGSQPHLLCLLRFPVLVWFGRLSFGIYMYHQAVSGVVHGLLRNDSYPRMRTLSDAGVTLLALCITLILAEVSYRFFEAPILRFGHRFQYSSNFQQSALLSTVPAES